ncbi:MAG: cytochrome bc complex cytochrome b subunit [Ardenticatenia bacterium]|nr:cytochrome bc complex cytochrome b subunit [Ardenticatenia bacterium]
MLGLQDLRNLPKDFERKVRELLNQDLEETVRERLDSRVRTITAGLDLEELRAIFRGDAPTEKPNPRWKVHTTSFLFHIRPRYYQRASTWFTHTFRLGWLSTYLFFIELITGIILMVYYAPTPDTAYRDMLNILSNVRFGLLMRDLHRLGAELMVIAVFLHMVRVYFTGSYKKPREFTWLTGVVLLGITLFLSFSGYLLPWDQLAYWAVTIGTSMADKTPLIGREVNLLLRGAPDIGAGGLLRFYLLHVLFLPLLAILFISVHYYKVSREHGISLPAVVEEGEMDEDRRRWAKERIDFIPDLLTHELFLSVLVLVAMVIAVTVWFDAPLESQANPQVTPLDTKAPWYFLWLQGMLKLGDPTLMGVVLPGIIVLFLAAIPYIDNNPSRLAKNRPVALSLGVLGVIVLIILSYMGTPQWGIETPPAVRIVQDLVPQEGVGPFRKLGYEKIKLGTFETDSFTLPDNPDEFDILFAEFQDRVRNAPLASPQGVWEIDMLQPTLKRVKMRITWTKLDENGNILLDEQGQPVRDQYEKVFFVHESSGYEYE